MTTHRYRFVSEWPRVFDGLRHEIEAIVHRHVDDPENPPAPSPPGSTVVLQPGDEIETPAPIKHPHLEPVNAAAKKAAADGPAEPDPPSTGDGSTPASSEESK